MVPLTGSTYIGYPIPLRVRIPTEPGQTILWAGVCCHFVEVAENRIKLVLFEKQITLHNYGGFFIESIYTL